MNPTKKSRKSKTTIPLNEIDINKPGIWIVQHTKHSKESNYVCRIGELPDPLSRLKIEMHKKDFLEAMTEIHEEWEGKPMSINEYANSVFNLFLEKLNEKEIDL